MLCIIPVRWQKRFIILAILLILTCQMLLPQQSCVRDTVSVSILSELTTKRLLTKKCNVVVTSLFYYLEWFDKNRAKAIMVRVFPAISDKISRLILDELRRNEFKIVDEFVPSKEDPRYSFHLDVMVNKGKDKGNYEVLIDIRALYHNPDGTIVPSHSWSAFFAIEKKLLDRKMKNIAQKMVEALSLNSGEYTMDFR